MRCSTRGKSAKFSGMLRTRSLLRASNIFSVLQLWPQGLGIAVSVADCNSILHNEVLLVKATIFVGFRE